MGILFVGASWIVLCLDFRAQVLQARRGIWQFNHSKVLVKTSLAYIGTQVPPRAALPQPWRCTAAAAIATACS